MSGVATSLNAVAGALCTTGAFTIGVLDALDEEEGWFGPCISKRALPPDDDGIEDGIEENDVVDELEGPDWLGPRITKRALPPDDDGAEDANEDVELDEETGRDMVFDEEDCIGLVKVWVLKRGPRGRLGLRKLGTRKPRNGFENLN